MRHYRLMLEDLQPISFWADNSALKHRLHSAFIEFLQTHDACCAVLYVHHHTQGWCQVFDYSSRYQIINNPLTLDYQNLIFAVIHTLAQCDSWPTEEEKRRIREKRLTKEHDETAQARRSLFRVL